ncbi:MAG: NAD(P)H-dependent oxidoreductase [Chloroflexota bacterium]|nr:NAD(P)H-dependent oxidoreductase [Chloroflexota bacterium]
MTNLTNPTRINRPVRILAIPGSTRAGSYNRRLLEAARDVAPAGVEVEITDIGGLPFYDADLEAAGEPAPVREFKERVRAADALLIATPEYNGSIPGLLGNALDWASRPRGQAPLDAKPVAILGATPSPRGGAGAQAVLRQVLTATRCAVVPEPDLLVRSAYERFDAAGSLSDEATRHRLRELLATLVDRAAGTDAADRWAA